MQAGIPRRAGLLGLALLLFGCSEANGPYGDQTFRAQYFVARDALENGQYSIAQRAYLKLIPDAGALAPRLRLEYAHTLLRAEDYATAASEARSVSTELSGAGRAAALAVQGTAEHELALAAAAKGEPSQATALMRSADAAMAEVLATHPDLDPIGALAARRASIKVRLPRLGG